MPGLPARTAAALLLSVVLDEKTPLDARLDAEDSPMNGLPVADRSLARAIVATALRRHGQIQKVLGELIERELPRRSGALRRIIETAAAQILFMEVPDHAAVSLALAAADADSKARHFKPVANGVLRALIRRREELLSTYSSARLNVPDWLWKRWSTAFGEEEGTAIADAHLSVAPIDISVKADAGMWAERLGGEVLPTKTVRCGTKGRIEGLPGYAEGEWWVQDMAAAMPARLLGDVAGKRVLDLCAAPGGKTAQLVTGGAKVTAVDISAARMRRVKANLARLGLKADLVTADALSFEPGRLYDAVLIDAPCSATGTIRRHPDISWLKSEADIVKLADLQRALLAKAVRMTRRGGTIVFATCSLESEEGEVLATDAPGDLPVEKRPITADEIGGLQAEWVSNGWLRTLPSYRPDPAKTGGMDGFFAARFVKA